MNLDYELKIIDLDDYDVEVADDDDFDLEERLMAKKKHSEEKSKKNQNVSKKPIISLILTGVLCVITYTSFYIVIRNNYMIKQPTPVEEDIVNIIFDTPGLYNYSEIDNMYTQEISNDYIKINGFSECILKQGECIALKNSPDNSVGLLYKIYIEDEMIYQTPTIPAGKEYHWNVSDFCDVGDYDLLFVVYKVSNDSISKKMQFRANVIVK